MAPPPRYGVVESNDIVQGIPVELMTRWRWRADRRARRLNEHRLVESYHWGVIRHIDGVHWLVVAYQNYLVPLR